MTWEDFKKNQGFVWSVYGNILMQKDFWPITIYETLFKIRNWGQCFYCCASSIHSYPVKTTTVCSAIIWCYNEFVDKLREALNRKYGHRMTIGNRMTNLQMVVVNW
jgi:hypothetical protein